jgi:protein-S-isoprenylcysteine O-methyltransferase Ste14
VVGEGAMGRILPTTCLLIALLAMLTLRLVIPGPKMLPVPWNLLGLVPLALGIGINLAADKAIHLAHTTVKPFEAPTTLITDGVYGFTRNPMYLGFAAILIGVAMLLAAWIPVVVVIAFIGLMQAMFIRHEEESLARNFGKVWEEYERRVRPWL